jgi:phosphate starvation-inducible membrane PsiE
VKTFFSQLSLDAVGFWASAGCALHCLAVPILLSVSAFSSLAFLNQPHVEEGIIALSICFGLGSMVPSYFRNHRRFSAINLLVIGFSLIGFSRIVASEYWEITLTSAGAIVVAIAHVRNHRLCKHAASTITQHV